MKASDHVRYKQFKHHDRSEKQELDGDIVICAEIICIHTYNNEELDVFHPLYEDMPSSTVRKAIVTHTGCQESTKYEILEAEDFHTLVSRWVGRFDSTCRDKIRKIVQEEYAFLKYYQ